MQNLLAILYESAWTGSIIPFSREPTYFALLEFGQPMAAPFAAALIGSMAGQGINYAIGLFMLHLKDGGTIYVADKWYDRLKRWGNRFGFLTLALAWMDFGGMLTVMAGFLRLPLKFCLPVIMLGQAWYYGHLLF